MFNLTDYISHMKQVQTLGGSGNSVPKDYKIKWRMARHVVVAEMSGDRKPLLAGVEGRGKLL
jgi:hypothetical protein